MICAARYGSCIEIMKKPLVFNSCRSQSRNSSSRQAFAITKPAAVELRDKSFLARECARNAGGMR